MTVELEVLDPRYDAEPAHWRELRTRAGLRADWSWEVLATQAWCSRTPLLIAVLRDAGRVCGVVCADWAGLPVRRNGFVSIGRGPLVGGLHVRAPGTGSVPGWWSAGELPTAELLQHYLHGMRRAIGVGCRGAVVRQLTEDDAARLAGRPRLVRPTEQLARLPTASWRTRDAWTATLARKRRQNLRTIFRRIDDDPTIEVTVEPGRNVDPVAVAAVLRHNERKYHGRLLAPLPQSTGYLAALLRQPDVFVGCYRDSRSGRLLAVVTILDHPQWPVTRHWSSVPLDRPDRPNLYLHHYGLVVSWALRNDKLGLLVGKGKPELKLTLGAELVPQFAAALPVW
jgi:hypothetical protein